MSANANIIQIEERNDTGKGAARSLRRENKVPGIIYRGKDADVKIAIDSKELETEYLKGHFSSKVYDLQAGDKTIKAIPRDIQIHPVTDRVLHVDFMRVNPEDKIKVDVAVKFINAEQSPGLKRGGVLNIVRRDVELLSTVSAIPEKLVVDLDGMQIGDSVHISSISLPEGAEPTIKDRDFTVATIVGRVLKTESEEQGTEDDGEEGEENNEEGSSEGEASGTDDKPAEDNKE